MLATPELVGILENEAIDVLSLSDGSTVFESRPPSSDSCPKSPPPSDDADGFKASLSPTPEHKPSCSLLQQPKKSESEGEGEALKRNGSFSWIDVLELDN